MNAEQRDEKFEMLRKAWYNDINIQYNVIDAIKFRETAFIQKGKLAIRCIKANAIKYLDYNYSRYRFFECPYNLYNSLAWYPDMPMFSFTPAEKRSQMDDFNERYLYYMTKYDFLIDIDNPDLSKSLSTLVKVKRIFDRYNIPAWYMFSGNKGFHVRIDWDRFPNQYKALTPKELCDKFKVFIERFKYINGFDDIDTSIYDLRRVAKTPYSIVYPLYFIAMPLSDEQINGFDLEKMSLPYNINRTESLKQRRSLVREGKPDGFKELVDEYGPEKK